MIKNSKSRNKVCKFCKENITVVNYKQVDILKNYITEKGKIFPRRISGFCAKHQRLLSSTVKRARHAALLPFAAE